MKTGKVWFAALAAVALLGTAARAAEDWKTKRNFDIGFTIESFENDLAGDESVEGTLPGVRASIGQLSPMYVNLSGRYSFGSLDLNYTDFYGNTFSNDSDDYVLEFRGLIGYDIANKDRETNVALYSGLGYWRVNNKIEDANPGFERTLDILYLPLGLDITHPLEEGRRCGLKAELDVPISATTTLGSGGHNEVDFDHDNGYGARFSLFYELPMGESSTVSIEPYVNYWDLKDSEIKNGNYAVGNDTTEMGVALTFSW